MPPTVPGTDVSWARLRGLPAGRVRALVVQRLRGLWWARFNGARTAGHVKIHRRVQVVGGRRAGGLVLGRSVELFDNVRLELRNRQARIVIGNGTYLNRNTSVTATTLVEMGTNCMIGFDVAIMDDDLHGTAGPAAVRIGNGVWIGARATITKGVSIGDRAVIGAGAVVTRDVPAGSLAGGVPARVIRDQYEW